jgi:hypothetical protein
MRFESKAVVQGHATATSQTDLARWACPWFPLPVPEQRALPERKGQSARLHRNVMGRREVIIKLKSGQNRVEFPALHPRYLLLLRQRLAFSPDRSGINRPLTMAADGLTIR